MFGTLKCPGALTVQITGLLCQVGEIPVAAPVRVSCESLILQRKVAELSFLT